jgi:hypothetical protein
MPDTQRRENWLKPSQVADLFAEADLPRPHRNTWWDWARRADITFRRTYGGQRRYAESEVRALVAAMAEAA